MVGRWDRVACLTLCAFAAPALLDCQGSSGSPAPPSTMADASTSDGSSTSDVGGPAVDGATADASTEADVGSGADARPPLDAVRSDVEPLPDTGTVIDAAPDVATTEGGGPSAGPILYPIDLTHSPITTSVATVLRRIAATVPTRNTHHFLKAGDPIMGDALGSPTQVIQGDFFGCVESPAPIKDLANYLSLQATIDHFHQGNVGGRTPFAHVSQCTRENLTSWDLLSQNLLPPEITATNPSLAFVMFGSVDIGNGGTFTPSPQVDWVKFRDYGQAMLDIEDALLAAGVVPVLLSMPPRLSNGAPVVQVSTFVALTRAIAQGRQTPFVDFNSPMQKLADKGLESDGLHITQYEVGGSARNCVFSDEGLRHGYNLMNLLGLQVLERVKKVVADGATSLDTSAPALAGQGTPDAPFEVPTLPFSDLRDLAKASSRALESYTGCGSTKEAGGEYIYRWSAATATRVRAVVIDKKGSPVAAHVYHLAGMPAATSCVASQSSSPSSGGLSAGTLAAGTHYFAVDSIAVPAGRAAEYMLAIVECDPSDGTCN
jgi:hypothetical protein